MQRWPQAARYRPQDPLIFALTVWYTS